MNAGPRLVHGRSGLVALFFFQQWHRSESATIPTHSTALFFSILFFPYMHRCIFVTDSETLVVLLFPFLCLFLFSPVLFFQKKPYVFRILYKLRGVGSDGDEHNNIVLMEEAAFIKPEIRDKIIIPLLTRTGSVLLTISTLGPMFDSWKRQTECRDDQGRPVFLVKTYSLVCDDCIEKGMPEQCMHKQDLLPRWQSSEDEAKVKAIMSNNPDAWRREALGIQGDQDFIPAFTPRGLAFLLQRDGEPAEPSTAMQTNDNLPSTCMVSRLLNQSYQYCFIAVDPAAGSTLSNYAVVSTVFETNGTVVVRFFFMCVRFFGQ